MYESEYKIDKGPVEVQVTLDDGTEFLGCLFMGQMQRISETLNDPRQFLTIRASDGQILHVRKSTIAKIMQLDQEVRRDAVTDPYEIIGVSNNIGVGKTASKGLRTGKLTKAKTRKISARPRHNAPTAPRAAARAADESANDRPSTA